MTRVMERKFLWKTLDGEGPFKDAMVINDVLIAMDDIDKLEIGYRTDVSFKYKTGYDTTYITIPAEIVGDVANIKPWYKVIPCFYIEHESHGYYRIGDRWFRDSLSMECMVSCENMTDTLDNILKGSVVRF